jgi:hypothetical protein
MAFPLASALKSIGLTESGFSPGRLLGSWLGLALTPLGPMLQWIFSPFFPASQLPGGPISLQMMLQFNNVIQQMDALTLLTRILPQLLLCLGVCLLFSHTFSWIGGRLESGIKSRTVS